MNVKVTLVSARLIPSKTEPKKNFLILGVSEGISVLDGIFHDVAEADIAKKNIGKQVSIVFRPYITYKKNGDPQTSYGPMVVFEQES